MPRPAANFLDNPAPLRVGIEEGYSYRTPGTCFAAGPIKGFTKGNGIVEIGRYLFQVSHGTIF